MKTASDIMTKSPACCVKDTGLQDVAKMMVDCNCGEIPIVNNESEKKIIGVVTDRDIVCRVVAQGKNPLECSAQDCMTESVATVNEETSIDDCLSLMEEKKVRRLPVVDQDNCLCGIISLADIYRKFGDKAERVMEEISGQGDSPSAMAS